MNTLTVNKPKKTSDEGGPLFTGIILVNTLINIPSTFIMWQTGHVTPNILVMMRQRRWTLYLHFLGPEEFWLRIVAVGQV